VATVIGTFELVGTCIIRITSWHMWLHRLVTTYLLRVYVCTSSELYCDMRD
jgi:hypothetical protein